MSRNTYSAYARQFTLTAGLIVAAAGLTACGGGGDDDDNDIQAQPPTQDAVVASTNSSGPVAVPLGSAETVGVSFTTPEGQQARNLRITNDPSSLPPGWSFDQDFSCDNVTQSKDSCQLNLTYAPMTVVNNNNITLNYTYTDITNVVKVGKILINYSAGEPGTVVATAYPANPVNINVGNIGNTSIVFNAIESTASNLRVTTDLGNLPTGWGADVGSFACSTIAATGQDCQLNLTYEPAAATEQATLPITYLYTDAGGNQRTGTVDVPYSAEGSGNGGNGDPVPAGSSETPLGNGSETPAGSGDGTPVGSGTSTPSPATPAGLTPLQGTTTSLSAGR